MNDNITEKILEWKKKRNAIILAHNYQRSEVQEIADICGDSLALAREAVKSDAEVIVLCGVHFMAESAAILNPDKTVLIPEKEAGCPMADMAPADKVSEWRQKYKDAKMIAYINTSAETKAEADIICTSSNAVKIVESFPKDQKLLFVPDKNLGSYAAKKTGRDLILYDGFCRTHYFLTSDEVKIMKKKYPQAKFAVHPECKPEVLELADFIGSTAQIIKFCSEDSCKEFIIGTEEGILHSLTKNNPDKKFYAVSKYFVCLNMKMITLRSVLNSLIDMKYKIEVEGSIAARSRTALKRMLEVT